MVVRQQIRIISISFEVDNDLLVDMAWVFAVVDERLVESSIKEGCTSAHNGRP